MPYSQLGRSWAPNYLSQLKRSGFSEDEIAKLVSGDFGCENGVIGTRLYKTSASFGTYAAGQDITGRVWDTKRGGCYIKGGATAKWDFSHV